MLVIVSGLMNFELNCHDFIERCTRATNAFEELTTRTSLGHPEADDEHGPTQSKTQSLLIRKSGSE